MEVLMTLEKFMWVIVTICYSYQYFYLFYMLIKKPEPKEPDKIIYHKIGVVISARNERNVIRQLIDSIHAQEYPSEKIDIYVVADNCTDDTAQICEDAGARVLVRNDTEHIGKGYALDFLFKRLLAENNDCDAFIVLDADNIITRNYVYEMNKVFCLGYDSITSYRNSKNYGTNWVSAGYSLWFLREAKYLNNARMALGTSCAISGTGFLISMKIIKDNGGWSQHCLTEDIEFSASYVAQGYKIGYAENAMLFDEQPETFKQSWKQRLRWSKGFYQVIGKYGKNLFKGIAKHRWFSCFDILMTIFPAVFVTVFSVICYIIRIIVSIINNNSELAFATLQFLLISVGGCCLLLIILGMVTVITEWYYISCHPAKKILYIFTFPIFMLSYIPIALVALFKKVTWTPIEHTVSKTLDDVEE